METNGKGMKKDFDKWNSKKKRIHDIVRAPFFNEREIWFCFLGANVGFEQDGSGVDFQRPVIVLKKFNREIFWGVPLTKTKKMKRKKRAEAYYFNFSFIKGVSSTAILSQIRLIDGKRLSRALGRIREEDYKKLTRKLKALFP